jgi:hypothetical protein
VRIEVRCPVELLFVHRLAVGDGELAAVVQSQIADAKPQVSFLEMPAGTR